VLLYFCLYFLEYLYSWPGFRGEINKHYRNYQPDPFFFFFLAKMLADGILDHLALAKVQEVIKDFGTLNVVLAVLVIGLTALVVDYGHMLYMRSRMPPGPFPWPIIGNTFSLPQNKPWIYFEELSKRYKVPLITFWIGR
jgi:hypothetical protein